MTYTYAIAPVSSLAYYEIRRVLLDAGYQQAVHGKGAAEVLDMRGVALRALPPSPPDDAAHERLEREKSYLSFCAMERERDDALRALEAVRSDVDAAQPFLLHAAAWMSWPDVPMPLTFAAKSIQGIVSAMHHGLHDAVADIARATTRAENAEAELESLVGPVMACCQQRALLHEYEERWMEVGREEAYAVGLMRCPDTEGWIEAPPSFVEWEQNR